MVTTPVIHTITPITTHLPTPEGWKVEMACRLTHSGQCTREVVTPGVVTIKRVANTSQRRR